MEFIRKSRRNWIYSHPNRNIYYLTKGVRIRDGTARFSVSDFRTKKDCEEWVINKIEAIEMNALTSKTLHGIKTKALKVTDGDWDLMAKYMPNPGDYSASDFRVYEDHLANNIPDRDKERFSLPVLKQFDKTIVGKQKLIAHDWTNAGFGRYFKSSIKKLTLDEALEYFAGHPSKKIKQVLSEVEEKDGGIFILTPAFYVHKSKEQIIIDLDTGAVGDASIGFMGLRREDIKDEDGELIYREFQVKENTEALEGSIVGVPAQYGAGTRKDFEGNAAILKTLLEKINEAPETFRSGDDSHGDKQGGKSMAIKIKVDALEYETEVDSDSLEKEVERISGEVNEKVIAFHDGIEVLTAENDELKNKIKAFDEEFGAEITLDTIKSLIGKSQIADELKADLVDDVIKTKALAGLLDQKDEKGTQDLRNALSGESIPFLKDRLSEYRKISDDKNPHRGLLEPNNETGRQDSEKKQNLDRAANYELD